MYNVYYLFSVKEKYFADLTQELKDNPLFSAFYGLAYAKNPVLKTPLFKHVSYVSDIVKIKGAVDYDFLEKLEKTYRIQIAEMMHADRHLSVFKKQERLFLAEKMLKLFISDMEKFKINLVLPEGVDDFISFFAAIYCQHHRIKFFYPVEVGYDARACISSSIYPEPDNFSEKFAETLKLKQENKIDFTKVETEISNYITTKKKPRYYVGVNAADYRALKLKDLKIFIDYIASYLRDRNSLPHDKSPYLLPYYRAKKILQKLAYKNLLKKMAIKIEDLKNLDYLIYPLHFEPEASTLIQGRWFNDQRKIIEMISKCLPVNTVLLVKEHRISIGRRPIGFYKEIIKYHNVFMVDDNIDTYQFIQKSKGVILISSTMGLEALLLQKPVMAFGERFFNVSKNVYVVQNYREIEKTIASMLSHQFDREDLSALIYTLFENTQYLGNTCHITYTPKDVKILAEAVVQQCHSF